jgi:hypothetical protein
MKNLARFQCFLIPHGEREWPSAEVIENVVTHLDHQ